MNTPYVIVRTSGDPEALLPSMRAALRATGPALPVLALNTMEQHVGASMAASRLTATALGAFSLLAIILACIGVYGMVAVSVASRRAEIGIRMAPGAARGRVVRMMMSQTALAAALGLVMGGALVVVAAGRIEPPSGASALGRRFEQRRCSRLMSERGSRVGQGRPSSAPNESSRVCRAGGAPTAPCVAGRVGSGDRPGQASGTSVVPVARGRSGHPDHPVAG